MPNSIAAAAAQIARTAASHSDEGYRGTVDNRSDMVDVYLEYAGHLPPDQNRTGLEWCGMFIYWCYGQAAGQHANPIPRQVFGGGDLWTWARSPRHSNWVVWQPGQDYAALEEGDIFVVSNKSHVGMVARASRSGNPTFTSVEGNQTDPAHRDWGTKGIRIRRNASLNNCAIVIRLP